MLTRENGMELLFFRATPASYISGGTKESFSAICRRLRACESHRETLRVASDN
jgi:hypothetical protein